MCSSDACRGLRELSGASYSMSLEGLKATEHRTSDAPKSLLENENALGRRDWGLAWLAEH